MRTNIYRNNSVGMFFEHPWTWSIVDGDDKLVDKGKSCTKRSAERSLRRASERIHAQKIEEALKVGA